MIGTVVDFIYDVFHRIRVICVGRHIPQVPALITTSSSFFVAL